ncbi:hypothetical protein M404DRAFT_18571 [Pisolithus tinctorius Marx 270]|uniref:Uncharacterized protein n=1 Tax=Pisolithus tinctorius Marx 270 TaxID=870435 RepID=A0A0C3JZ37_PISTI|nr:hypothetical protein M404DRAFT_18571 [Pisolithus tinctorius Marx 270]
MYTMNQPKFHINANQVVPTSQANKTKFVGPLTVIKHRPHILQLHVPTSVQNVMLSFEPNSQGPVTIEISLTTMSPELGNDTFHATQACVVDFGANIGTGGVKLESADAHVSAISDPLLINVEPLPAMQGPFGCIPDHLPPANNSQTNPEGGTALPIAPCIPVIDESETEPKSMEGTPTTAVKETTLEIPVSSLPAQVSGPSVRHTFTPDSFAGSETFDTVKQEMLDHGTLSGEDLDILTFGSALPNLGLNFHSPKALLSTVDYFQEYNARMSAGTCPLTSFRAHHLPPAPEQHAVECQLRHIAEELCDEQNNSRNNAPPLNYDDMSYANGSWSYPDETDHAHNAEVVDAPPHPSINEDNPNPFLINEEV